MSKRSNLSNLTRHRKKVNQKLKES